MNPSSRAASSSSRHKLAGVLHQTNKAGELVARRNVFVDQEITIGRDSARCQYTIRDPCVSNKHLRIYTIIYDDENPDEVAPLVYAEDLSRNGTYWNGSLIGKGNGGFLISDGDTLRLSSATLLRFERGVAKDNACFDLVQENEMKALSKSYVITDRLLGAGACGKVYMAVNQFQRRQVACKLVDLRKLRHQTKYSTIRKEHYIPAEDVDNRVQLRKVTALAEEKKREHLLEDKLKSWYREADILASINHPNIIGLEKVFVTDNTLYIFQDLVTAGDLFSYLESKNGRLMDVEAAIIVRQILIALQYLHGQNIVHRDVKPDNILMTTLATGCRVVLTDFGGARKIAHHRQRMVTSVGTTGYSAPEVLGSKSGYSKAVDMWSVGCVTVVLLTGGSPFRDPKTNDYSETLANECNLEVLERTEEWAEVMSRPKDFVGKLLVLDETHRLAAKDALQHPWFSNDLHKTDFEELYKRIVRHWRPKCYKKPIVEFMNSRQVKHLACSQEVLATERRTRGRSGPNPVEPPYKPFPRTMHQPLFAPRRPPGTLYGMSEEVQKAIQEYWTSSSSSDGLSDPETLLDRKRTEYLQPLKPSFRPLQQSPSVQQRPSQIQTLKNGIINPTIFSEEQPAQRRLINQRFRADSVSGASSLGSHHPATPRPKTRGIGHTLPLRSLTAAQTLTNSHTTTQRRTDTVHELQQILQDDVSTGSSDESSNTEKSHIKKLDAALHPVQTPRSSRPAKANSDLKLRTPQAAKQRTLRSPASRKRRRGSIYDIDVSEDDECESEHKRQRSRWQTSVEGSLEEAESPLVPRTPPPAPVSSSKNTIYLPRL